MFDITPILAGLATFCMVFLRGFQQKNVHGNHYLAAFCTSYVHAGTDIAVVLFMVKGGWSIFPYTGTGAAVGIISAMWIHNRFLNRGKHGTGQETRNA